MGRSATSGAGVSRASGRNPEGAWWWYVSRANGVLTVLQQLARGRKAPEADWNWLFHRMIGKKEAAVFRFEELLPNGQRVKVDLPKNFWPLMTSSVGRSALFRESPGCQASNLRAGDTLKQQRVLLAHVLNHWLDECETGLCVTWESDIDVRFGLSHPQGSFSFSIPARQSSQTAC